MKRPLGAQISHYLKSQGVEVIFGIPGVHNQEMYRGIEEAGIRHVLARHEQGAGFMADGYARATGKPGVAYVITGPGLCNIMTPMGQAYSDSVSMLVLSSCLDETSARRGQLHQMLDQAAAGSRSHKRLGVGESTHLRRLMRWMALRGFPALRLAVRRLRLGVGASTNLRRLTVHYDGRGDGLLPTLTASPQTFLL